MDPRVQAEYDDVLAQVVIKRGTLVSANESLYGWIAQDWLHISRHREYGDGCRIVSYGRPVENEWDEFAGTFEEVDHRRSGVDLPGVSCACGKVENRTMRLDVPMQQLAEGVFMELYGRLAQRVTELESRLEAQDE